MIGDIQKVGNRFYMEMVPVTVGAASGKIRPPLSLLRGHAIERTAP